MGLGLASALALAAGFFGAGFFVAGFFAIRFEATVLTCAATSRHAEGSASGYGCKGEG